MSKKEKAPVDPEVKRLQYLWGGVGLLLLGTAYSLCNAFLAVPDYQKVSSFSAFFFVVGGGVGIVVGARGPRPALLRWIPERCWLGITLVVLACAGFVFYGLDGLEGATETDYMLLYALVGAYFLFLFLLEFREAGEEKRAKAVETAEVLIVAIALAIGIKGVGVQAFKIPSGSMLQTLQIGDHLLISKFLYGIPLPYTDARVPGFRDPERGDIIVFTYPGKDNPMRPMVIGMSPPENVADPLEGQDFIKRVIGLPGDRLKIQDKRVFINGKLFDDPWGEYIAQYLSRPRARIAEFTVPEDMYFVMGDNRDNSDDSRVWGFVEKGRIKGKALIIYWSWAGLGRIGTTF